MPQDDLWVNLAPGDDRVITKDLAMTAMGEDMLKEDYLLKQISSSLTYPETDIGKDYWNAIYAKNSDKPYDPVSNLCRVWIVPDKTLVYEDGLSAVIKEAPLQVLSDMRYRHVDGTPTDMALERKIIPQLNKIVNESASFARMRQIYHAFVLAHWFKTRLRESVYAYYFDQKKLGGIDSADTAAKEQVYKLYLEAFKKGAYDYIKKDKIGFRDVGVARKITQKRYYCGGAAVNASTLKMQAAPGKEAMQVPGQKVPVEFIPDIDKKQIHNMQVLSAFAGSALPTGDLAHVYYTHDEAFEPSYLADTPYPVIDTDGPDSEIGLDYYVASGVIDGKPYKVDISIREQLQYAPVPNKELFLSFDNGRNIDIVMQSVSSGLALPNKAERGEAVSPLREAVELWLHRSYLYEHDRDNVEKMKEPARRQFFQLVNLMATARMVDKYGYIALTPLHRWFISHVDPARARAILQEFNDYYYGDLAFIEQNFNIAGRREDFAKLQNYIKRFFLPALRARAALDNSGPDAAPVPAASEEEVGGVLITTQAIKVVGDPVKIKVSKTAIDRLRNSKGMGYRIGEIK